MHLTTLLADPRVYRLWQSPFALAKIAPVLQHTEIGRARSVLDLGCGPGTNAGLFTHAEYTGVDVNAAYIAYARSRYRGEFICADATGAGWTGDRRYDLVLLNSLLHHLDTEAARGVLAAASNVVTPDGFIHVIDLVLPEAGGLPRTLARLDRGGFARPLERWRTLLGERFGAAVFEPFSVGLLGLRLWDLVYFKGKPIR